VVFVIFIVPLFGTVIFGMLWKRTTPAAGFWGLLAGILVAFGLFVWVKLVPSALVYVAFSPHAKDMSENIYRAMWSLAATLVVTFVVSLFTRPKPESELQGLVYGLTPLPSEGHLPLLQRPIFWAGVVAVLFVVFNIIFW
jgi:SSS family solute:Na+ symporter